MSRSPNTAAGHPPPDFIRWLEQARPVILFALVQGGIPEEDANDVLQEASTKAINSCRLRTLPEFKKWLHTTAYRLWVSRYHRRPKAEKDTTSYHGWTDSNEKPVVDPVASHRDFSPHDEIKYRTVMDCLSRLSSTDRQIIEDRFLAVQTLTFQEIANKYKLGKPKHDKYHPNSAKREVTRIVGELNLMLESAGIADDLAFEEFWGGSEQ